MKSRLGKVMLWLWTTILILPSVALAGAAKTAQIVIVADTRKFTGWEAWWTNLYNESHLYFTLLTIILIPAIGLAFGLMADLVMHFIGLDLKSRELAEH